MRPLRFVSVLIACRASANGQTVFAPSVRGSCRLGRSQLPLIRAANPRNGHLQTIGLSSLRPNDEIDVETWAYWVSAAESRFHQLRNVTGILDVSSSECSGGKMRACLLKLLLQKE